MKTIPRRYQDAQYEDVPQDIKNSFEKIRETRKGIYMFGPVGTGKTHYLAGMKREWDANSDRMTYFLNTVEMMQEIKDDFDRARRDKTFLFERIMEDRNLIFLDDIGAEKMSDWVLERFYLIINKKYNDRIPVIFTSNHSLDELAELLGDRVASRIVEMCDVKLVDGKDKRINK